MTHEFFEHTADVGIRATADSLGALCVALAQGLTELAAEDSRLEPRETRTIDLAAADAPTLVLKWLQELLFWFSTERFLPAAYALEEATPTRLRGTVQGERFDPVRHVPGREVKAITRHQLDVRQEDGRWIGQVIVDI
jgi:SHS2 domain-containing protein